MGRSTHQGFRVQSWGRFLVEGFLGVEILPQKLWGDDVLDCFFLPTYQNGTRFQGLEVGEML